MNAFHLAETERWLRQQTDRPQLTARRRTGEPDDHVRLDIHDGDRLLGSVYRYVSGGWGGKLAPRLAGGPETYINGARPTPLAALQTLWNMRKTGRQHTNHQPADTPQEPINA